MLINCPECEKKISSYVNACPHCGFPAEKHKIFLDCPKCGDKERSANIIEHKSFPNFSYHCARCGTLLHYMGKEGWGVVE